MQEYKKIWKKEMDIAGKYRAYIDIGEGESIILKFHGEVDDATVKKGVEKFLINREAQKEKDIVEEIKEIDNKIIELSDRKVNLEMIKNNNEIIKK